MMVHRHEIDNVAMPDDLLFKAALFFVRIELTDDWEQNNPERTIRDGCLEMSGL
jgi:hypothetical protein